MNTIAITFFCLLLIVLLFVAVAVHRITVMPGKSYRGDVAPLNEIETALKVRLQQHIDVLANDIGERNLQTQESYARARDYLLDTFNQAGYDATLESFDALNTTMFNIVAVKPGTDRADEVVIIGAHYDTVPGSPGANDNGSGLAAVVELARAASQLTLSRTVRFVAFANEEAPYFGTDAMGSLRHLQFAQEKGENIVAMFSLETIGSYSTAPNSQHYPKPFNLFYPTTGNFVGFVGDTLSRRLVRDVVASFRAVAHVPSEGVAAPRMAADISRSDHSSYWQAGIPAVMVTDTANFRYGEYHTAQDTPDVINFDVMAQVVHGLTAVMTRVASSVSYR